MSQDDEDNDADDESSVLPLYAGDSRSHSEEPRSHDGSEGDGGDTMVSSDVTFEPPSLAVDDDVAADSSKWVTALVMYRSAL